MKPGFTIMAAPLQGYTEAAWRNAHARIFGGVDTYFTPFVRVEHGEVRSRDLRDALSPLNEGVKVVPQIIFRNADELRTVMDAFDAGGVKRVDLNMGCPFPPQMKKGRGAGIIGNLSELESVADYLEERKDVEFSVKMRLGAERADEWKEAMPVLNRMRLSHVTMHPRTGRQQYKGETDMTAFAEFLKESAHPVVYNGDVKGAEQVAALREKYPGIAGVMTGRGLLECPWLAAEIRKGESHEGGELVRRTMALYDAVAEEYRNTLCGETQVMMKLKPFWDYAGNLLPRKIAKQIAKATGYASYERAVAEARLFSESL